MSKKKSDWSSSSDESDSYSNTSYTSKSSRSSSSSFNSSRLSKSKKSISKSTESFLSESIDIGDKDSKKTKTPSFSDTESIVSSSSQLSESNSLHNLKEEYEPIFQKPSKVVQCLNSIKQSVINVYNLKKKFKENLSQIKIYAAESDELKIENDKISDLMINERLGSIALSQVIYGSSHWRYAMAYTELALVYLEFKNLPKQAKHHCETSWYILYEELKNKTLHEVNKGENQLSNFSTISSEIVNKHQMMLNYIYGRACTILKENEKGRSALEKSEEFYENWKSDLSEKKLKIKYKDELKHWRLKIYFALAKQYAIVGSNGNALAFYDQCIDCLDKEKTVQWDLLIEVYTDKATIELKKENYEKSVDILKECMDKIKISESDFYILECKMALARIFSEFDDMNSSAKSEDMYKECIDGYKKMFVNLNEKLIIAKDELVKFYLKQEKYEDAFVLLEDLLKNKIDFYGDFSSKLISTYKLICSIYLKRNDLSNAIKNLQKSLEIEELNYGKLSKNYLKTLETIDNLQGKEKTKSDKPVFNPTLLISKLKLDCSIKLNFKKMGNEKILKDQNVPSEPRAKYLCTDQKEKLATHSYNLRSKARQQQLQQREQESQVDINNNHRDYDDLYRVAVKRGYDYDTVDNETEDDSTTPLNTHMLNVRKSPPKKLKFVVTYKEMTEFFNLLKDQSISEFLRRDACCLVSDKYALAMVFTYFKRAKFTCEEFTVLNFYLGLYLASDVEEDIDEYKYEIFPWALGPKWRSKFSYFLRKRDALLKRIGYRAIVSRKCCDEVMSFVADHYAWKRERSEDHGGATRAYLITKGRRMLSNRSQVDDDDLNLPRGPQELPRPCPLCFLSKSTDLINNTRYFFPMKPGSLFMPKSTGLLQYATVFNSDTESADYDTSSNTSGYVSNESHASSNLSTYSTTETSFYSNGIDLTIRQKDDLPACIIKQI
ncbi:unnamed protein product [Brachionus calyciflorus]|uniref:Uncharacterized protein n=1 Tax=Brachionus calyciflorus TaxID=104777 RepID=A0A813TF00_9BILA|nr:unnamed protein product [Brachionus calyciflorus]